MDDDIVATVAYSPAMVYGAVVLWADVSTAKESGRRRDLMRDKTRVVNDFFEFVGKHPGQVRPADVKSWQGDLEARGLAASTVYNRSCLVSSFYSWLMKDPEIAGVIRRNPVDLARPKAPRAYQNESCQSLDDNQVKALLATVRRRAEVGDLVAKRDYALLLFYLTTGMRRAEVLGLRWGDLEVNGTLTVTGQVKGGDFVAREVADPGVKLALLDYLEAAGRLETLATSSPLWTRHDYAGQPGKPLSSHAFVRNLKRYARDAGIGEIHLHQLRHTYGRLVAEESGSLAEVQEALGHKNLATTRVYVRRVAVKRDKFGAAIAARLG